MRIFFLGVPESIHAIRWIEQVKNTGWDLLFLPSRFEFFGHVSNIPGITLVNPLPEKNNVLKILNRVYRKSVKIQILLRKCPKLTHLITSYYFALLIILLKPTIIHSLGLNINWLNNCQNILQARKILSTFWKTRWIFSSWGTDFDYYAKMSDNNHSEVIDVLHHVEYYIAECKRDFRLSKEMGFNGTFLGYYPAFGGFPVSDYHAHLQKPASGRRRIFLKGRDHRDNGDPVGRAGTALKAFNLIRDQLTDYEIIIAQASPIILKESQSLIEKGLNITLLPRVSYEYILSLIASSRIFISLTVNDGLPSSLVEAMALGAFPIHSNLEPIREWIENGKNGFLVNPEDPVEVSLALSRVLSDDNLVNSGQKINYTLVKNYLSTEFVQPRVQEMYLNVVKG